MAEIFFYNGFEDAFYSWTDTDGSPTVQKNAGHHRLYAAQIPLSSKVFYTLGTDQDVLYSRVYVKWTNNPTSGNESWLFHIGQSDPLRPLVYARIVNDSGTMKWGLRTYNSGATFTDNLFSGVPTPDANNWYCIELKWQKNTANGAELYVNGNLVGTTTATTNDTQADRLTLALEQTEITAYYDCVVVSDSLIGVETDLDVNNLTIADILTLKEPNGQGYITVQTVPGGPILEISQAINVKDDFSCYGFVGTATDPEKGSGGGAIMMGHGFKASTWEPEFVLLDTVGGGTGATASITSVDGNGTITSISVDTNGDHYNFADITVNSANGSGARLAPIFDNKTIQGINIFNGGIDYEVSDTISITNEPHDTLYLNDYYENPAHLHLGNLIATGNVTTGQLNVKSTNNLFSVTAGDNGVDQDTYLIPQNPSNTAGLGLGTSDIPFKWVDATNVFADTINGLKPGVDLTITPNGANKVVVDGELKVTGDLSTDAQLGIKSPNNLFAVTAQDNGVDQDTYLVPQDPGVGAGLGLGSAGSPFKWVDATNLFADTLNGLNDVDMTITPTGGRKVVINGDLQVTGAFSTGTQKGSNTTDANGDRTVNFAQAFGSAPLVFVQSRDSSGRGVRFDVTSKSTTSFTVKATVLPTTHKHKIGQANATVAWTMGVDNATGAHQHGFNSLATVDLAHTHGTHQHGFGAGVEQAAVSLGHSHGSHSHTFSGSAYVYSASAGTPSGSIGSDGYHHHQIYNNTTQVTDSRGDTHNDYYAVSPAQSNGLHSHSFSGNALPSHGHSAAAGGTVGSTTVSLGNGVLSIVGGNTAFTDITLTETLAYVQGYTQHDAAHGHDLSNKAPYARSIQLRDISGSVVEAGGTMTTVSASAQDLYTEAADLSAESKTVDFDWMAIPA